MRVFLGLLQKDIQATNEVRIESDIEHIETAVEKMGLLLEDLLALSRVGRIVNPSENVDLLELVNGVVSLLRGVIDNVMPNAAYRTEFITRYCASAAVLLWSTWSLRCAYKHYLRMPHSLAIAVASQAIAVLAAFVPLMLMGRNKFVADLVVELFRWFGIRGY